MEDMASKQSTCPKCQTANPPDRRFCDGCGSLLVGSSRKDRADGLIGTIVGNRFTIIEKIGQGGMGVVYRGEQTGMGRAVALKVLRPRFSNEPKLLERFRNEASTASRLSHPNTIEIYDFGVTEGGRLYIAMELVEGTNLDDAIRNGGSLDWQRTCLIGAQICGSLEEAHSHNIVHRDLKPENIMLTQRGEERDVVKVLDFGIAKILANEGMTGGLALTAGSEFFGTPEYMAPEQIRREPIDHRTDVYALGVILYRMLTGSLPFSADTPLALLAMHLTEPPIPLENHNVAAEIPGDLKALVLGALAKDRNSRPASMRIIGEQLRRVANLSTPPRMSLGSPFR